MLPSQLPKGDAGREGLHPLAVRSAHPTHSTQALASEIARILRPVVLQAMSHYCEWQSIKRIDTRLETVAYRGWAAACLRDGSIRCVFGNDISWGM